MSKRLTSLAMLVGFVLLSYAAAAAQQTTPTTTTTTTTPSTTTSTNSRVVITDNLAKPSTASTSQTTSPTTTKKIGNYSVNTTEGVTGQNLENGKFLTVTKWDGTKWVTKREWVPNNAPLVKPNSQ